MKYYKITCYTPFVGESNDYYIKTNSQKEFEKLADECVYENANEWCDDQTLEENGMSEDDYYADCGYYSEEIDREEYLENCPWDDEAEEEDGREDL